MKKIFTLWAFLIAFSIYSQNQNSKFVGVWEKAMPNNETFKVTFFTEEDDSIGGHYSLSYVDSSGNNVIVYKSKIELSAGIFAPSMINGIVNTNLSALIFDINFRNHKYNMLTGNLLMEITQGDGNVGSSANWTVKRTSGIRFKDDNREFVIPVNLILTKTSN